MKKTSLIELGLRKETGEFITPIFLNLKHINHILIQGLKETEKEIFIENLKENLKDKMEVKDQNLIDNIFFIDCDLLDFNKIERLFLELEEKRKERIENKFSNNENFEIVFIENIDKLKGDKEYLIQMIKKFLHLGRPVGIKIIINDNNFELDAFPFISLFDTKILGRTLENYQASKFINLDKLKIDNIKEITEKKYIIEHNGELILIDKPTK